MRLNQNKILITGATSGIGSALTSRLSTLDNQIIAVGRDEKKLKALVKGNNKIVAFKCDLASEQDLLRLVSFIKTKHYDLNVLINNAGIQYNVHFLDSKNTLQNIEHEIAVNLAAPIKLIASLIPVLKNNANSAIVNVSSGLAIVPKAKSAVYCGTKAGLHIFSKSLRYQLKTIKVFEIIPPLVDTPMTKGRGSGKISPEHVVDEFIKAFQNDSLEVNIQKVKLLRLVNRMSPRIADAIMKRATL